MLDNDKLINMSKECKEFNKIFDIDTIIDDWIDLFKVIDGGRQEMCGVVSKDKLLTINKVLITVLILIQPIVDIIKVNVVKDIQFLGFSLFEFINIFE